MADRRPTVLDWLGIRRIRDFTRARPLGHVLGVLLILIGFAVVLGGLLALTHFLLAVFQYDADHEAIRNIGLVLVAVFGAPFVAWRSWVAHQQADTAAAALVNQKLNDAFESLAARHSVTMRARTITCTLEDRTCTLWDTEDRPTELPHGATEIVEGPWHVHTREVPDIVTRSAAIDRLHGLAQEMPSEVGRISSALSIYVRETSKETPPRISAYERWQILAEPEDDSPPMEAQEIHERTGLDPEEASLDSLKAWASALKPQRSDVQLAVQVLGKLRAIPEVDVEAITIDLRDANLQGFELAGLDFTGAQMQGVNLSGADLIEARMQGANLRQARLQGADLTEALMQGAILVVARMEGACCREARMEGAYLREARMEGADFVDARMERAVLFGARMQGANLNLAWMQGAGLVGARMQGAFLGLARMEGAILRDARMQGADLVGATFDRETDFTEATVAYASLNLVDVSSTNLSHDQVKSTFGDGSVTLPEGLAAGEPPLAHWPAEDLEVDPSALFFGGGRGEFYDRWRAWQREQGYEPP